MKFTLSIITLGSFITLAACEQKSDTAKETPINAPTGETAKPEGQTAAPAGQQAAGQPSAAQPNAVQPGAGQPAAQPSPWASREKLQQELQTKVDAVATKVEALKQKSEGKEHKANSQLREHLAALHSKVETARDDVKAIAASTEATFADVKAKAEKSVQELELAFEQAGPHGVN